MSQSAPAPGADQGGPTLKRNAVGVGGAVVMSAALMGPAVSVYFNPQVTAGQAGLATPFVFVLAAVVMAVVANGVMEMARVLPSAGSFYTYVSRGIGPKTGFVTGVMMFIAYALLVPAELALFGSFTHDVLAEYGWDISWWIISAIALVLMLVLSYEGITGSLRTALILFSAEVIVILVLSTIILVKGGRDGLTLEPLNPANSTNGLSGIALGLVFGILSFVGFEAATTLGEEVKDPKRNVPKGIIMSLIFVGAIYLYCTYAEMVGFGREGVDALAGDTAPFTTLAGMYAPWIKLLIGLAGISSIFAVIMNSNNGIVRIIFAMGRERMLPRQLAHIHPKHQTPSTAIWVQGVVAALFTFGVGALAGPFNTYIYLGAILTLAIIPVYMLTQVACLKYFGRSDIGEMRNPVKHIVLPILGLLLLLIPVYGQVWPVPAAPINTFPYLVIAAIVIATMVAWQIGQRHPEVLARAGAVLATGEADPEHPHTVDEHDDAGMTGHTEHERRQDLE